MAIVQVSRITNRKGLADNLPQLAGAELGWAIDTRQLYIGNGTLDDGAPVVGNTEILTEFSDVLALSTGYTYKGDAAGYTVQTGPSPGTPISQSLQLFFDERASITDFGAVGDGVTDNTDAINRALYQLFCRESNPQIRRSLYFPAGRYLVTGPVIVPPYARLYGEGADSSVIVCSAIVGNCIKFCDSLGQTDANISNNGATPPTNIEFSNIGFSTISPIDIVLVQDATFCNFTDVCFDGPLTNSSLATNANDTACVRFSSTGILVCNSITFCRCKFSGATWAFNTDQQVQGVVITDSDFDTLYQGILLGDPVPVDGGPTGFRITSNSFDNIYAEAIRVAVGTGLNVSGNNIFYDVGNHFNGVTNPSTPIINFFGNNNLSIGDMFERSSVYSTTYPRISINHTVSIGFDGSDLMQLGTYVRETGLQATLVDNSSATLFTIDGTKFPAFVVNYAIIRDVSASLTKWIKTGAFTVTSTPDGSNTSLQFVDDGVENRSTGVVLSATETVGIITVSYTTSSTGAGGIINYSITHLA